MRFQQARGPLSHLFEQAADVAGYTKVTLGGTMRTIRILATIIAVSITTIGPAHAHDPLPGAVLIQRLSLADMSAMSGQPSGGLGVGSPPVLVATNDVLLATPDFRNWTSSITSSKSVDVSTTRVIDMKLTYVLDSLTASSANFGFSVRFHATGSSPAGLAANFGAPSYAAGTGVGVRIGPANPCRSVTELDGSGFEPCTAVTGVDLAQSHSIHLTLTRAEGSTYGKFEQHFETGGGTTRTIVFWPTSAVTATISAGATSSSTRLRIVAFSLSTERSATEAAASSAGAATASPTISAYYRRQIASAKAQSTKICAWWKRNYSAKVAARECKKWLAIVNQTIQNAKADSYLSLGLTPPGWDAVGCTFVSAHIRSGRSVRAYTRC